MLIVKPYSLPLYMKLGIYFMLAYFCYVWNYRLIENIIYVFFIKKKCSNQNFTE